MSLDHAAAAADSRTETVAAEAARLAAGLSQDELVTVLKSHAFSEDLRIADLMKSLPLIEDESDREAAVEEIAYHFAERVAYAMDRLVDDAGANRQTMGRSVIREIARAIGHASIASGYGRHDIIADIDDGIALGTHVEAGTAD